MTSTRVDAAWYVQGINHYDSSYDYRKTFNMSHTQSQNLNVSRLILQLSLPNPLKTGICNIPHCIILKYLLTYIFAYLHSWTRLVLVQVMACPLFGTKPLLKQCWLIVICTLRNKLQWNLNRNTKIVIFENVVIHGHLHTVRCRYNAVNFITNVHKRHPMARPLGRGMGCLLWIQHLIDIMSQFLQLSMQNLTILDRVITAFDCMLPGLNVLSSITILLDIPGISVKDNDNDDDDNNNKNNNNDDNHDDDDNNNDKKNYINNNNSTFAFEPCSLFVTQAPKSLCYHRADSRFVPSQWQTSSQAPKSLCYHRADSRFVPSQWQTSSQAPKSLCYHRADSRFVPSQWQTLSQAPKSLCYHRADSRFVPSQWQTSSQAPKSLCYHRADSRFVPSQWQTSSQAPKSLCYHRADSRFVPSQWQTSSQAPKSLCYHRADSRFVPSQWQTSSQAPKSLCYHRADSRFVPSQWQTSSQAPKSLLSQGWF